MRTRQMVVLLIALGMLAAGCGGDDDGGGGGADRGPKVSGTGYEFALADGWTNRTKDTEGSAINFDLFLVRRGGSSNANVIIVRETVGEATENDELRDAFRDQVEAVGGRDITPTRRAELDGEEAFTYKYVQRIPGGGAARGRQVALVHDGYAYTIALSAPREQFGAFNEQFSQMLSSWQWK